MKFGNLQMPFGLVVCLLVGLFSIGDASAETIVKGSPCAATEAWLDGQDWQEGDDLTGCSDLEHILLRTQNWADYAAGFQQEINIIGFPVMLDMSLNSEAAGRAQNAFYYADMAIEEATVFFTKGEDGLRGKSYGYLIRSWRNSLIDLYVPLEQPTFVLGELTYVTGGDRGHIVFLQCLAMSDPFVGPISRVLESKRFRGCLAGS